MAGPGRAGGLYLMRDFQAGLFEVQQLAWPAAHRPAQLVRPGTTEGLSGVELPGAEYSFPLTCQEVL